MRDRDLTYFERMYEFAKRVERRIAEVSLETFLEDIVPDGLKLTCFFTRCESVSY